MHVATCAHGYTHRERHTHTVNKHKINVKGDTGMLQNKNWTGENQGRS